MTSVSRGWGSTCRMTSTLIHETMDEAAAMEASGESGVHMEPAEDDIGSDRSQETAFSQTADVKSNTTTSLAVKFADDTKSSGSDESRDEVENEAAAAIRSKKRRYPYGPLFFIMTATAGQRYA